MTESLSLSLQAFPKRDEEKESLEYLIQRINVQKGSFRNVTEQDLRAEIEEEESGDRDGSQDEAADTVEDVEDAVSKREEVIKAREEILKQTARSLSESQTALEFVSLLLSKHVPAVAQITMSPFLKQTLPLGCLGAEVVQVPPISKDEKESEESVGLGWRIQSLNGAADSLFKSASRLEGELGRETRYWEQVLAVKEKGWSLHRLPREKHTLGVRYGFAEAHADFRDRGLAALRRDENGNISLDRGLRSKGDHKLRVRILHQGVPIASNSTDNTNTNTNEDVSVEREILNARNSIFDEELYHEIDRESRNLVNHGVRCIDSNILLPYEAGKQIEISLVPIEEENTPDIDNSDPTATAIALSLRILLSHAHRQTHQNRTQPPPPIQDSKPPRPIYALLKPILEYIQHQSHVKSTEEFLQKITNTLKAAGINSSISKPTTSPNLSIPIETQPSNINTLLQTLTSAQHTTLTLSLPTPSTTTTTTTTTIITIHIHTSIPPPHFGTTCTISTTTDHTPSNSANLSPPSPPLTTLPSLQSHLLHHLTLTISQILLSTQNAWTMTSPHIPTLTRKGARGKGRDIATLSLSESELTLRWRNGEANRVVTWRGDDGKEGQGEGRSLVDVFGEI